MKKYAYIGLLLFCLSCTTDTSPIDIQTITTEVKTMVEAYTNHVNNKGLKGVDYYFSKDDRFFWVEDGLMQYPNRESLIKGIEDFYPSVKNVTLKISQTDVQIVNANTVSLFIQYVQDIELHSGFSFTLDGAMTILTIKEGDSWKFLNGHSSIKKPRGGNQS